MMRARARWHAVGCIFGQFVETPWTFENSIRSMVRKSAIAKSDARDTLRTSPWRLFCFTTGQFELDFQRQIASAPTFATVSISNGGAKPLYFALPPVKPQGFEVWGLRMTRVSLQSLAGLPQFDFTETTLAPDGQRVRSIACSRPVRRERTWLPCRRADPRTARRNSSPRRWRAVGALFAPQAAGTEKPSTRFSSHAFVGREHDPEKHALGQKREACLRAR
jgi:hypothetical protein